MDNPRPLQHLISISKRLPNLWKTIDHCRENFVDWPEWCYFPVSHYRATLAALAGIPPQQSVPDDIVIDSLISAAVGTWRVTQGIYRFDPDIYEAIKSTRLKGNLPCEIFYRLPEWCVYIETPGFQTKMGQHHGAFVYLGYNINLQITELRILVDSEPKLIPIVLYIGNYSVLDALKNPMLHLLSHLRRLGVSEKEYLLTLRDSEEDIAKFQPIIEPIISLILYLCAQNAEYAQNKPIKPLPTKTKNGLRFFPPHKPTIWEMGVRLGTAIRQYRTEASHSYRGKRGSPCPHIRRAHWHSYPIGKKSDGALRKTELKWLLPIGVKIKDNNFSARVISVE